MKQFLAVYTGTPDAMQRSGWNDMTEQARQARIQQGIQAWHAWMQTHAAVIVVSGGPLGTTKRVSATGVEDTHNNLSGYVVVKAESHAAAADLFKGHPHFAVFPGDAVEIMECLPVPGA